MLKTKVYELVPANQGVPEDEEKVIWIASSLVELKGILRALNFKGGCRETSFRYNEPGVDLWLVSDKI